MSQDGISWLELHPTGGTSLRWAAERARRLARQLNVDVLLHFGDRFVWCLADNLHWPLLDPSRWLLFTPLVAQQARARLRVEGLR
jgi:hypothetical protein